MNGSKLRNLRKQKGYTIEEFSSLVGFTASYISQIERNKVEPSLNALNKICEALNVSLYYFVENENSSTKIIRNNNRKVIFYNDDKQYSFMSPIGKENGLMPEFYVYQTTIKPGEWDSNNPYNLGCHKCIIVKEGTVLIEISESNEILEKDDSIYINAQVLHRCYNPTNKDVKIVCVISQLDLS